jgi:Tol biopolymer transport system component
VAAGSAAAPARESRIAFVGYAGTARPICPRCPRTRLSRIFTVDPSGRRRKLIRRLRGSDSDPAWSRDGRRLAFTRLSRCRRDWTGFCGEIYTSDADGRRARRVTPGTGDQEPTWSPDGSTIAFVREFQRNEQYFYSLFVVRTDGREVRQVTRDHVDEDPAWSPDGTAILFSRGPPAEYVYDLRLYQLMLIDADGSNLRPFPRKIAGRMPAWSPTGRRVAFIGHRGPWGEDCRGDVCGPPGELYVVNADGTGLKRLTRTEAGESDPTWSPDGRWIAFSRGMSSEGRRRHGIYRIRPTGGRRRVVVQGAAAVHSPAWRPN